MASSRTRVASSGDREDNGRIGAGGSYVSTERFKLDAEVSDGDLGPGGRIGSNFLYSERTNLYLNYALENERTDNGLRVRRGNLVSGVKTRLSDSSSVYVEERYQDTGSLTGLTHATGVKLAANERWNFGANADFGTLTDSLTGAETDRKAGGVRMGYGLECDAAVERGRVSAGRRGTTRHDASTERTAWLFRNNFKYQLTPDWRVIGKLNHSISDSSLGEFYDGGYTEAVVGYAYRPVRQRPAERPGQVHVLLQRADHGPGDRCRTRRSEFIQKSHIAALDLTYDLTADWSVGGKYAYRLGQVSLDREHPQFFDNSAQLMVLRADWRFRKGWESMVEARMLDLPDVESDVARGALVAVYRYIGENLKVGAGYNFTDFSDDLTDLSYDHQGVFVNVIGTM